MVVISRTELERMRACTRPEEITDAEARRRRLKTLSDEKVKKWPNTLQAMRKKKESWKKDRLDAEERARVEIDREEAELQHKLRSEAIQRANSIMYEQTDKMKCLRSQQMYSDVMMEREEQAKERGVMKRWELEKEGAYHKEIMRQVAEGDAREKMEAEARSFKARSIAQSQSEQLGEFRGNYLERLRNEKREGELIQKKAISDIEDDERVAQEKQLKARMQMKEMQLANAHLKKLKFQDSLKEQEADAKRKAEKERSEWLAKERKRLEQQRFDQRQATKQRLIDAAAKELSERINNQNEVLERQVEEQRKKEDNLEALKQRNIQRQKRAIDLSRSQQLEQRMKVKEQDQRDVAEMVEVWRRKNIEIDSEEAADQAKLKAQNAEIRDYLEKQIKETDRQRARQKAEVAAFDKATKAAIDDEQERFYTIATEVLDKARAQGKPTYMLEKARAARDVTIQPAMGERV